EALPVTIPRSNKFRACASPKQNHQTIWPTFEQNLGNNHGPNYKYYAGCSTHSLLFSRTSFQTTSPFGRYRSKSERCFFRGLALPTTGNPAHRLSEELILLQV